MDEPTQHLPIAEPTGGHAAGKRGRRKLLLFGGSGVAVVVAGLAIGLLSAGPSPALADSFTSTAATTTSTAKQPGHQARGHRPGPGVAHLAPGESLLVGTVAGVQGGDLTVNSDGGGPVTVTIDSSTVVRGQGVQAFGDLKLGERVVAEVKDGKALGVLAVRGHAAGTLTSVSGDHAVLERLDGLVVNVDLSGIQDKPKAGDVVVVMGQAADDGKTLKATNVRELPHAGS